MFDIGASELLVIVIVAILVIGPKDMPVALRTAGRWIGKIRRTSSHFRAGIDALIREAELAEMHKKWQAQNEEIMARLPHDPSGEPLGSATDSTGEIAASVEPDGAGDAEAPAARPAAGD